MARIERWLAKGVDVPTLSYFQFRNNGLQGQTAAYAASIHDYKHSDNLNIQLVEKHNYRNYQTSQAGEVRIENFNGCHRRYWRVNSLGVEYSSAQLLGEMTRLLIVRTCFGISIICIV